MLSITSLGIAPGGTLDPSDPSTPTTPPGVRPPPRPPRQMFPVQSTFTPTININPPVDTMPAPQPTYQPIDQPPVAVMCPDGSSAADISLCPVPLDIGPIVTVTPTDQLQPIPTPTQDQLDQNFWSDLNPYNVFMKGTYGWPGQVIVGLAALGVVLSLGSLLFGSRK